MAELLVIALLGGGLAWIRARTLDADAPDAAEAWSRWEAELQDTTRS